jgi:hypothetical protein
VADCSNQLTIFAFELHAVHAAALIGIKGHTCKHGRKGKEIGREKMVMNK